MELFSFRQAPAPGLLAAPSHGCHRPALHAAARPPGPTADPPSMQPAAGASARPSPYLSFPRPLLRLWPPQDESEEPQAPPRRTRRGSWVTKILRVRSIWEGGRREEEESEAVNGLLDEGDRCAGCGDGDDDGCCEIGDDGDGGSLEIDGDIFSRLLRRASLPEVEFFSLMSYLACLAYAIPKIKPEHLLKSYGLRLVTSSIERRSGSSSAENKEPQCTDEEEVETAQKAGESKPKEKGGGTQLNSSGIYGIVASAASYVHSQAKNILPLGRAGGDKGGTDSPEGGDVLARLGSAGSLEEASFVVASESVTAVVAAKDEVKQAVADDLSSSQSSPCEWFACDDDTSGTRYFVIQGSETLASWQANLLFEPIQFEGLDVLVHRGIYEAAKGIYQQMLPEIRAHLASRGDSAKLRFTGHSLGGSLSLLINLMLLTRGEVPASALLPVVTFGAPSIFCGGNALLEKLGLPRNHLQAVTLHRDIVPRAFSCTYPDRVTYILKAVNGNFRNHPCLKHQRLLYSPMGEILILQPEESFSPHHHLLPSGSGLYFLGHSSPDTSDSRLLRAAFSAFLNNPHPLEILSDRSAYGPDGTVMRDHDAGSYLGTVRMVIRAERKRARKAQREHSRLALWEHFFPNIRRSSNPRRCGKISNSLNELGDSPSLQLLLIFVLPARLLLLGALTTTSATFI